MVTSNRIGGRIPSNDSDDETNYDKKLLLGQSIVTLIILSIFSATTWTTRPFLDDSGVRSRTYALFYVPS